MTVRLTAAQYAALGSPAGVAGTDDDAHADERDAAYMREVRRQP
jgi:hypothetical protein